MKNDLVSVIIPAFNAEKYIKDAIFSVLNQTYPYFEIIVVDDASTDNTAEVVRSIKDERVQLIQHIENMGPGGARNTGIEVAKGIWFAELDADDQWLPSRLETLLGMVENVKDGYFLADNHLICFDHSNGLKPWISKFDQLKIKIDGKYTSYCFYGEDFEFYINLFLSGLKLKLSGKPFYLRRMRPGSLSTKDNNELINIYNRLLADVRLNRAEKEALKNNLNRLKKQQQLNNFSHLIKSKEWLKALKKLLNNPSLVSECMKILPRHNCGY
ncbi:MAG: glycosyltransferase family 2 protein [Thermacetogeniaceae bacterium]